MSGFETSGSLRERVSRLRNFQSEDFWAMVFARPLTILLLIPLADRAWVTPNRITWASVATKAAGLAALVAWGSYWGGIAGALLVNLGLVLDNMDGTLARYRGSSSYLGYYLDKSVDIILLAGLFAAMAVRSWLETGEVLDLGLTLGGFAGASVAAYCKWVAHRVETDIELRTGLAEGSLEAYARRRVVQNPSAEPPQRTAAEWVAWLGRAVKSILYFNEVDIFFFVLLALVLHEPWIFTRVMCGFYAAGALIGPGMFYFKLRGMLRARGME